MLYAKVQASITAYKRTDPKSPATPRGPTDTYLLIRSIPAWYVVAVSRSLRHTLELEPKAYTTGRASSRHQLPVGAHHEYHQRACAIYPDARPQYDGRCVKWSCIHSLRRLRQPRALHLQARGCGQRHRVESGVCVRSVGECGVSNSVLLCECGWATATNLAAAHP